MLEISPRDSRILKELYPPFAKMADKHLQYCHEIGIPMHLSVGVRSPKAQEEAFEKGYSGLHAWQSKHQYFIAYDVCFDNEIQDGIQDPYKEPFTGAWKQIADIAESIGIRAGYYFKKQDKPHFEAGIVAGLSDLKEIVFSGGREALYDFYEKYEQNAFKLKPLGAMECRAEK